MTKLMQRRGPGRWRMMHRIWIACSALGQSPKVMITLGATATSIQGLGGVLPRIGARTHLGCCTLRASLQRNASASCLGWRPQCPTGFRRHALSCRRSFSVQTCARGVPSQRPAHACVLQLSSVSTRSSILRNLCDARPKVGVVMYNRRRFPSNPTITTVRPSAR